MQYLKAKLIKLLVKFFDDDYRRIAHALDVLDQTEKILKTKDDSDEDIIIACAILHDMGIKQSEKELGYNNGKTQEQFGPSAAEVLLKEIDFPEEKIIKVKEIISNHHSVSKYDYIELEILKEADKIVNKNESNV
ncbi:MAG: HD domain-containing protein [Candidatus Theseobacter exili]|nr:HD domain-containing protein [Candidatus Theseobacter exili]